MPLTGVRTAARSNRKPTSATDRLPLEAEEQLGLTGGIWLKQNGKTRFVGRGIDGNGGDYHLVLESGQGVWSRACSYTLTDKRTGEQRRGEVRW